MNEQEPIRRDVYQEITDRIVIAIEAGAGSVHMPWHSDGLPRTRPTNAFTGDRYHGVNIIALWATGEVYGYTSGYWGTFKQWRLLGGHVRKGEKGTVVVFYKETEREVADDETGEREIKTYLLARSSWVFNADQIDGWQAPEVRRLGLVASIESAERFVANTKADIRHGGDRAYYRQKDDHIQIPDMDRFTGTPTSSPTESYYAVLLHELTHWTGHKRRLDRDLTGRFGDESYAMEELVAEIGAAFLCADLGISNGPREDHAAYVANWLNVLKNDKRAIFTAASKAGQAAEHLSRLQIKKATEAEGPSASDEREPARETGT